MPSWPPERLVQQGHNNMLLPCALPHLEKDELFSSTILPPRFLCECAAGFSFNRPESHRLDVHLIVMQLESISMYLEATTLNKGRSELSFASCISNSAVLWRGGEHYHIFFRDESSFCLLYHFPLASLSQSQTCIQFNGGVLHLASSCTGCLGPVARHYLM